ncbi:MAG: flotillin domain-containing protein, partial [Psychrobium sp.]
RDVEVSEQDKQIAVAEKSEAESAARAKAAEAEKERVEKEESVITTRQVAEANRRKEIEVIDAKKEAERDAVGITVQADAEKRAAEDKASAILIEAKADADATMLKAEADERILAVEAAGKQALYEAENILRDEQIELQRALATLKALPEVIANSVKPLENIEGIKILQGYGGGAGASGNGQTISTSGNGSMAEQVTAAALNYRANAPLVDSMLQELGLVNKEGGTLNDLLTGNNALNPAQPVSELNGNANSDFSMSNSIEVSSDK